MDSIRFSKKSGVPQPTISQLKVGKENTLLIKYQKIAEALGIKTEELMKNSYLYDG
ncbi:helix-turn-helix domain-containing protein [Bacillus cytotoxicus]|uniref:helix-turn-helix domain-containing protein n=1 Tax=Bacillus cytotoxicus TaxID=580165 RepID=UPI001EF6D8CB|nr:helix-turn-helix transcriptional regulator [Bacillus cytotoxicus]